jgi:predicted GH43/DUF377 family glycosyl hydrolase
MKTALPFGALALLLSSQACAVPASLPSTIASPWTASAANPILSGRASDYSAWNDPCVLKDGESWLMYLSRNISTDGGRSEGAVAIFRGTSADGIAWSIAPSAALEPGTSGAFDFNAVETPSVLKFGGKWHLYYGGISQLESSPSYRIGHAVSDDGIAWTEDGANPVLGKEDLPSSISAYHVGEPGALVAGGKIVLYFAVTASGGISIWRSVSSDGSSFSAPEQVLSKGPAFSDSSFLGYSTPCAVLDSRGRTHLFYDLYQRRSESNGGKEFQVALVHAVSYDGASFVEDSGPFLSRLDAAWTAREVRSPWVVAIDDTWRLWYAGDDYKITATSWTGSMGIGYAEAPASAF